MKNTKNEKIEQAKLRLVPNFIDDVRNMVEKQMRGAMLGMALSLFKDEVEGLCGPAFSRKGEERCHRGGSETGRILCQGQQMRVKKPRVRSGENEVALQTYSVLQNYDMFSQKIMDHMLSGVSTRNYDGLLHEIEGGLGVSKSKVSKAFVRGSKETLDMLNARDLSSYNFAAVMVDGVGFGERLVVAALGITDKGKKIILGIREGETEDWEVCRDLLTALVARGLSTENPMLFVIDGAKALKKAIKKIFGAKAFIQRCVRHKERNILKYLPKAARGEFCRRWKKLHGCTDMKSANEDYAQLSNWLGDKNYAALQSLEEAERDTLTAIELGVPRLLRETLLSTNPLESSFSRVKPNTDRVKNWKSGDDQVSRWAATCLFESENHFIAVRGGAQIPIVIINMKNKLLENQTKIAV